MSILGSFFSPHHIKAMSYLLLSVMECTELVLTSVGSYLLRLK